MHLQVDDDAEETPRPLPEPYRRRVIPLHHELGSRELMLGWCFWLLGSWFALGMGLSGTPISRMIFASLIGLLVGWPLFRLSQDGCGKRVVSARDDVPELPAATAPPRRSHLSPGLIFRDWVALNGVFQAVVWPHLLTGQWRLEQAMWVSVAVAAWSLLAGAIVAWGCGSCRGGTRLAAMLLVLLLLLGEPALLAALNAFAEANGQTRIHWTMHISPIEALAALTVKSVDFDAGPWAATVICVILAGATAWAWLMRAQPRPPRGPLVHRHGFR